MSQPHCEVLRPSGTSICTCTLHIHVPVPALVPGLNQSCLKTLADGAGIPRAGSTAEMAAAVRGARRQKEHRGRCVVVQMKDKIKNKKKTNQYSR